MKTIEEKAKEISQRPFIENKSLSMQMELTKELKGRYDGFKQGVEFAQRWISMEEEMPEIKDTEYQILVIRDDDVIKFDCFRIGKFILSQYGLIENYFTFWGITHWRKIELI